MSEIGKRVKAVRKERGLSMEQLAEKAGKLRYQTIQDLENGKSQSSKHLLAMARALGVHPDWLETGEGPKDAGAAPQSGVSLKGAELRDINIGQMPRDVPVYGIALCGEEGLLDFNGQIMDHVPRPPRLAGIKDAYALYVSGDSMSRWREHGQKVYVHPGQPPKIGDYVVVQMHPDKDGVAAKAYIKRLAKLNSEKIVLEQFNPPAEKTLLMKKVKSVHRIIDWDELLGL